MILQQPAKLFHVSCIGTPICYHVGVMIIENGFPIIYNNTPTVKNEFGGNIVSQTPEQFFKNRKLISCRDILVDYNNVKCHSFNNRFRKWTSLDYNCEDYVNELLSGKTKSDLRNAWQTCLAVYVLSVL